MNLIVLHNFWMKSKKFEYKLVKQNAKSIAKGMRSDREGQFNHCDYTIIELTKGIRPRKLTWLERISGNIK